MARGVSESDDSSLAAAAFLLAAFDAEFVRVFDAAALLAKGTSSSDDSTIVLALTPLLVLRRFV